VESRYSLEAFTQGYVKLLREVARNKAAGFGYMTEPAA
jgi:hypothetical protein